MSETDPLRSPHVTDALKGALAIARQACHAVADLPTTEGIHDDPTSRILGDVATLLDAGAEPDARADLGRQLMAEPHFVAMANAAIEALAERHPPPSGEG